MKTSREGIALIKRFEGLRLKAYRDSVGIWTIGYGHTSMAGKPTVSAGLTITAQEAEDILVNDLVKYEAAVDKAIKRNPTQSQFDAMVSLCFNIGPGAFAKSSIARKFNAGDVEGAADAFLIYRKAGGKVLPGLEARRRAERAHFLKDGVPNVNPGKRPNRAIKTGSLAFLSGAGAGAVGMFAGFDWQALLVLLAFLSFWLAVFAFVYRKELPAMLGRDK